MGSTGTTWMTAVVMRMIITFSTTNSKKLWTLLTIAKTKMKTTTWSEKFQSKKLLGNRKIVGIQLVIHCRPKDLQLHIFMKLYFIHLPKKVINGRMVRKELFTRYAISL